MIIPVVLVVFVIASQPSMGPPRRGTDQDVVQQEVNGGRLLPFREVLGQARRVVPGAVLIGTDFDQSNGIYVFKFIKQGEVSAVYVDARSGEILQVEGR